MSVASCPWTGDATIPGRHCQTAVVPIAPEKQSKGLPFPKVNITEFTLDMKRDSSLRLFGDFKKSWIQTNNASVANTEYLCYVQYYLVGEIIVFFLAI